MKLPTSKLADITPCPTKFMIYRRGDQTMTPNEIYKAVAKMVRSNQPGTDRDKLILELYRRADLTISRSKLQGFYRTDPDDYRARRANLTDCQNLLTALLRVEVDKPVPMAPLTARQQRAVRFMALAATSKHAIRHLSESISRMLSVDAVNGRPGEND